MSRNLSPDDYQALLQLRADGYQSALREIGQALCGDDTPAARQRAGEISRRLNRRLLSECRAAEVASAWVAMLESLEAENRALRDENQALRAENELFSRSILRLQSQINTELVAGKSPPRS